jgi:hypothetical protein
MMQSRLNGANATHRMNGTWDAFLLWALMLLPGTILPAAVLGADPVPPPPASEPAGAPSDQIPPEIAVNMKELKKSCGADYKKLCPDVRMGGGRIVRCLKEHEAELSAPCRQVVSPGASK